MNLDGALIVHAGITRSGKTLRARLDVKDARRLLVWDPKGAWAREDRCEGVHDFEVLLARIRAIGAGPARLAFISTERPEFDRWAELAFWWGRWGGEYGERTHVVVEEQANVTSAFKAQPGLHLLLSQGLEFGLVIYVLTQAPSEGEKTSFRNRTLLRVFQADRDVDAKMMAAELRLEQAVVDALKPLEYIERDRRSGRTQKFSAKKGRPFPKWTPVPL